MAFALLRHAVRLVLTNWRDALKISIVLFLVQAGASVVLDIIEPTQGASGHFSQPLGTAFLLVQTFIGGWIAVGWHRFVLLDEVPSSYAPTVNSQRVIRYVRKLLLITLILVAVEVPGIVIVIAFASANGVLVAVPIGLVLFFVMVVISLRLGLVLPAVAVDKQLTFRESWGATSGTTWLAIRLGLMCAVGLFLLMLPLLLVVGFLPPPVHVLVDEIWATIMAWFVLMVSVALLTTAYGYYVEHRPIQGNAHVPATPPSVQ